MLSIFPILIFQHFRFLEFTHTLMWSKNCNCTFSEMHDTQEDSLSIQQVPSSHMKYETK